MPEIEKISAFASTIVYIRWCFYVMGIFLIWGGIKKIRDNLNVSHDQDRSL